MAIKDWFQANILDFVDDSDQGTRLEDSGKSLASMADGSPKPDFSSVPAGADFSFEEIYAVAGISEEGFTIKKVIDLLGDPSLSGVPIETKVLTVKVGLSAAGATIGEALKDAVQRDLALDAYEARLDALAKETESEKTSEIEAVQNEIQEFLRKQNARIETAREAIKEAQERAFRFSQSKKAEEKRLHSAVAPFVTGDENPITLGKVAGSAADLPKDAVEKAESVGRSARKK